MYYVGNLVEYIDPQALIGKISEPRANGISSYVRAWEVARLYKQNYPRFIILVASEAPMPEDPKRVEPVA